MNKERTKKAIEVMQAYVDGAEIQVAPPSSGKWSDLSSLCTPAWSWGTFDYRVKPREPRTFFANEYKAGNIGCLYFTKEDAENMAIELGVSPVSVVELREVIRD